MTGTVRAGSWILGACCTLALACGGESPAPPPAVATAPPSPKVLTAAERADWYRACWDKFNAKAWDEFKKCYGDAAEGDPGDSAQPVAKGPDAIIAATQKQSQGFKDIRGDLRLILVNGPNIASVSILTGTNTEPLPNPDGTTTPPTKKAYGLLFGHTVQTDDTGSKVLKESDYLESGTMLAQLGLVKAPARPIMTAADTPATIVVATGSATETSNVAAEHKSIEDWNRHDTKALEANIADDVVWREVAIPKDLNKKGLMDSLKEFWKGISDVKITPSAVWAAGDYVVLQGVVAGVNDGNIPSMGLKKTGKPVKLHFLEIDRFEGGKLKEAWLFYDGGAMMQQLTSKTIP
jgi:predicted ester cyclase